MSPRSVSASPRRFKFALAAAFVVGGLFAVLLASPLDASTRADVSAVGMLLGAAATIIGGSLSAARTHGRRRRAWVLLVSAAALGMVSNAVTFALGADPVEERFALGEVSLAVAMLLSVVGLLEMPTRRQRGTRLVLLVLDGLVMGCAALVIVSVTVYPQVLDSEADRFDQTMALLFPLLDVALATVALLLMARSLGNRSFFAVVGSAFVMYAVADLSFAVEVAQRQFAFGSIIDIGWIGGYLLLAAAAWHPDASSVPDTADERETFDLQGTVLVFGTLLAAITVQLLQGETALTRSQLFLWTLLVCAIGARQALLTIDNVTLRQGLEQQVREQTADLRRMARQTEVLLRSVGDGIYGVDLDGRVTFVNPSGARALGYEPEQMLGMPAHDRMHAPDVDGNAAPWDHCYVREAIRDGKVASAEEDRYLRADGTIIPVEITASPLLDKERISGAVVVFRDVTQRQEVDRMKNEFLSVVSHELRTPLTAIRGSLGLLATGAMMELTPRVERVVGIAVDSSERLTRLINDILDIERIQSGRLPMTTAPQEAAGLLNDALTEMGSAAAASGVRLVAEPSTAVALADSDRIVQALTNLVGNAIKFSRPGDTVHVSAQESTDADGDMVTFCVRDQGRGIPEDKLEAVFQPFEQVDSSDAREKGGTGLGLAISRGIVEQHGGRIWAESGPGAGATVRFTVPSVRRVAADELPLEPAPTPDAVPAPTPEPAVTTQTPQAPREGEGSWQV